MPAPWSPASRPPERPPSSGMTSGSTGWSSARPPRPLTRPAATSWASWRPSAAARVSAWWSTSIPSMMAIPSSRSMRRATDAAGSSPIPSRGPVRCSACTRLSAPWCANRSKSWSRTTESTGSGWTRFSAPPTPPIPGPPPPSRNGTARTTKRPPQSSAASSPSIRPSSGTRRLRRSSAR